METGKQRWYVYRRVQALCNEELEGINKASLYGKPLGYRRYGRLPGELVTVEVT